MPIVSAATFREAFLASYEEVRHSFRTKNSWQAIWQHRWKHLMLARPKEASRIPPEGRVSVLARVATRLGLHYPSDPGNREPMTLDAILVKPTKNNDPFPMRVAIEHEKQWPGFDREIKKLLSVRCPLKVGITYTPDSPKGQKHREKLAGWIREDFEEIKKVIEEDTTTEYLFIIGAKSDRGISSWHSFSFHASEKLGRKSFRSVWLAPDH